jgi:hypothetical protein
MGEPATRTQARASVTLHLSGAPGQRRVSYNGRMSFRSRFRIICVLLLTVAAARAQQTERHPRKYVPPPPTAHVEVTVVKAWNGRPILNAAVVFRPSQDGKEQGSMELKTNEDGKAELDLIPVGTKLRLQVIARGFQTYGDDYDIDSPNKTIVIKMNKPTKLYSIYDQNSPAAKTDDKIAPTGSVPAATDPKQMPPDHPAPPAETKPNTPQPNN